MGSDGVFDNLFDEQIMRECIQSKVLKNNLDSPQDAAQCISSLAEVMSYNTTHESPWTLSAIEHGYSRKDELGGKEDDITVIVA